MHDCFDALNALPDRDKRNLLQRIKDRIRTFFPVRDAQSAFDKKTDFGEIFQPNLHLPTFSNKNEDIEVLKYAFIGKQFENGY